MTSQKIFPRNLTARLAYQAVGNPASSRLEDEVGNCFPGLGIDLRNLDRRFFPGLVFNFAGREHRELDPENPALYGARVASVEDECDLDLHRADPVANALLAEFHSPNGRALRVGEWFIDTIEQFGKTIALYDRDSQGKRIPMDGMAVWRIVRSLSPGPVRLVLMRRDVQDATGQHPTIALSGWRRQFVDAKTGTLNEVYQPGELVQSLCSPWQHDMRDCACMYWASNRPDVVFAEVPAESETSLLEAADVNLRLDWLRRDRTASGRVAAPSSYRELRQYQLDNHEINSRWMELNFVLESREIQSSYRPPHPEDVKLYASPGELAQVLRDQLIPLELTLSLEYLYAYFSLHHPEEITTPDDRFPTLVEDLSLVRRLLLQISVSEMTHYRWAHQLLWSMHSEGLVKDVFTPVITLAPRIPRPDEQGPVTEGFRDRALRPLTPAVLADFIAVERPSGYIDGAYARAVGTLRLPTYPERLYELAVKIDADGMGHYSKLLDIARVLAKYDQAGATSVYLRDLQLATATTTQAALETYQTILLDVQKTYAAMYAGEFRSATITVDRAREQMTLLQAQGEQLARQGLGIPFFDDASAATQQLSSRNLMEYLDRGKMMAGDAGDPVSTAANVVSALPRELKR
jgi:Ferritin-like